MNAAESPAQIDAAKTSLQVWVFESVLRAFGSGNVTYADVLARLRRLLATGTSPTELLKIVRRSQLTEPLPESAQEIVDILNDVIRRDAGEAVESTEVQDADTQAVAPREEIMESRGEVTELREEVMDEEVMEETGARQHAAHEMPTRSYEPTWEPEWVAAARTTAITEATTTTLAADLAAARVALTAEQRRTRDLCLELAGKDAVVEGARSRVAEILRDYERQKSDAQILRDSLETRDTIIDQMQIALDDRDTRLAALQQEHAKVTPTLEAHVKTAARLEADLQAAIARTDAVSLELKAAQDAAAVLNTQLKRSESHLNASLTELGAAKSQSSSYLELIRTREWCRGFDHNMIRELDAQVGAANAEYQALETERDRLQSRLAAADSERARLTAEVAARDRALLQAREHATGAAQSIAESKEAADQQQAEQAAQIAQMRAEHAAQIEGLQAERAAQLERLQGEAQERAASAAQSAAESRKVADLRQAEQAAQIVQMRAEHAAQIEGLQAERAAQLERMQAEAQERAAAAAQSVAGSNVAAALRQAELAAQITQLRAEQAAQIEGMLAERAAQLERMQADADQREQEMGLLMAHLGEARRLIEALESERDRLQSQLAAADSERAGLTVELAAQIERLQAEAQERATAAARSVTASNDAADMRQVELAAQIAQLRAEHAAQLERMQAEAVQREEKMSELTAHLEEAHHPVPVLESERDRLKIELAAADSERARLTAEVAARDRTLLQAQELATSAAQSVAESKEAADLWQAELATQIAELRAEHAAQMERLRAKQGAQMERLRAEADQREEEMGLLMAHLLEARRPVQALEADRKRLTEELAERDGIAAVFDEQNRKLAAILEWTRDALEECETIMRRLGPSESNNANVLGRIQASVIERLKSVSRAPAAAAADPRAAASEAADRSAELVRIDGEQATTYVLAKRTRIGRATACELKIDSASVSRHHALVIVGPRDTIIEDLNSTNGVLVNGRKVTRRVLIDGDALTIGDSRFRYFAPLHDRRGRPNSADGAAPRQVIQ